MPTPTLDQLAADPAAAGSLPRQVVEALLARTTLIQSALVGRLLCLQEAGDGHPPAPTEKDRWLTVKEAAVITSVNPRWFYHHWKQLPFARKLSRKTLRLSEAGLHRWLATKKAGQP